jgi:tRNA threonylcarbamoyladenosine biosynthesis protein TsaE
VTERRSSAGEAVVECATEAELEAFGRRLGQHAQAPLGVGKTTCARGFVLGRGHTGSVKSPTFTLVEPYPEAQGAVYHFDLYRICGPEEFELAGLRDYFTGDSIRLVEWPERGGDRLGMPDLALHIEVTPTGRTVIARAHSERGAKLLESVICQC